MNFVESRLARRYSTLESLSAVTFKRHLEAVQLAVLERIRGHLVGKLLGLLINAWTEGGTHFAAVIVVVPSASNNGTNEKYLLCFTPFENESDMSADAHIELIDYVLDAAQLCVYVCDHASVNTALSTRTLVPLVGCASHRLQLAVRQLLEPFGDLLNKVHTLVIKLNTVKNRHRLREAGALMPVPRNTARWSSIFRMVKRYFEFHELIDRTDAHLLDVMLSRREESELRSLFLSLRNLESVNKRLQVGGRGEPELSLFEVRRLFDGVIRLFPSTASYLAPGASSVVRTMHFEKGIVKVLEGNEGRLTAAETAVLRRLERTRKNNLLKSSRLLSNCFRREHANRSHITRTSGGSRQRQMKSSAFSDSQVVSGARREGPCSLQHKKYYFFGV